MTRDLEQYVSSTPVLQILVVGDFLNVVAGLVAALMMVTGQENFYLRFVLITALVKLLLMAPAIYVFGAMGVSVVSACGAVAWTVALAIGAYRRLGVVTFPVRNKLGAR